MHKTSNSLPQDQGSRLTRIRTPKRRPRVPKRQFCSVKTSDVFCLLFGICVGNIIMFWTALTKVKPQRFVCPRNRSDVTTYNFKQPMDKQFILIGVMTTRKFLETRALDAHETWGSRVPGSILYFVGGPEAYTGDLPVVTLNNINDTCYPPQRKSFTMIEFISETLADHYEWFVRSDDDIYIRTDKLEFMLRRLDSSKAWFIGQPWYGSKHKKTKLGLVKPFCMGGVGITFSRSMLVEVGKHLVPDCLNSTVSSHEDTELGRCVYKFTGLSCSTSSELWSTFVHNRGRYTTHAIKLGWLEEGAITLHPIKVHPHMQRIDSLYSDHKVRQLEQKITKLQRDISDLDETLKTKTTTGVGDVLKTVGLNIKATVDTSTKYLSTRHSMDERSDKELESKSSPKSGAKIKDLPKFIDIEIGYEWDYLDKHLYLKTQRCEYHKWMSHIFMAIFLKSKIPTELEIKYGSKFELKSLLFAYSRFKSGTNMEFIFQHKDANHAKHLIKTTQKLSGIQFRELMPLPDPETWIILPLIRRPIAYRRFLEMLVRAIEKNGKLIKLKVLLYVEGEDQYRVTQKISHHFRNYFKNLAILTILVKETFSRGRDISKAMEQLPLNSLLIFMDVDMYFDEHFLHRAVLNSIRGKQVWFPICISQFNPIIACYGKHHCSMKNKHGDDFGMWQEFGFRVASMYKQDLIKVGGLNYKIEGWVGEDHELYEKFIQRSDLQVLRTVDPSLIQIYHEESRNREELKYKFWEYLGFKLAFHGSVNTLANIALDKGLIV